ncbi:heptaprenyl diphosphate synthase component 1 [Paenibacillus polysaccharolyticus]|uniref:heptaprenyl diphosphate synthase component 1 n=1 Tax=Paenibacillus polysaccharolyticus TaxID=582692 RepID=UPI0012B9B6F7|nr:MULTISPECIES: heptaprenyl diphosphate synthase component 1 [Paenibacillus]MCP1133076.1 heptaprenyl diphosphate synthase component 1 [Paenibacillus polysaccharolyticus]
MNSYRVPQLAKKYTDYDMIRQHTEIPSFPDSRARLLQVFVGRTDEKGHQELYALATSLVQLAMDTHDRIDTISGDRVEQEMRSRQLNVLAGDYLSSRFYQLLAHAGKIEMIGKLSGAVSEVNARKMTLYERMKKLLVSADEYLRETVQLRMQLFLSFTDMMPVEDKPLWNSLLMEFSTCETIIEEMDRMRDEKRMLHSYAFWYVYENGNDEERGHLTQMELEPRMWSSMVLKHSISEVLLDKLRECTHRIQLLLQDEEGLQDMHEFEAILEPYLSYVQPSHAAVRED